jgi:hypothetical protein
VHIVVTRERIETFKSFEIKKRERRDWSKWQVDDEKRQVRRTRDMIHPDNKQNKKRVRSGDRRKTEVEAGK